MGFCEHLSSSSSGLNLYLLQTLVFWLQYIGFIARFFIYYLHKIRGNIFCCFCFKSILVTFRAFGLSSAELITLSTAVCWSSYVLSYFLMRSFLHTVGRHNFLKIFKSWHPAEYCVINNFGRKPTLTGSLLAIG